MMQKVMRWLGGAGSTQGAVNPWFDPVGTYRALVLKRLLHCGISENVISVDVQCVGRAEDGLPVFAAQIHLVRWQRAAAIRLLLGLPLIEGKVRTEARESCVAPMSHFLGLWIHVSRSVAPCADWRSLVCRLAGDDRAGDDSGADYGPAESELPSHWGAPTSTLWTPWSFSAGRGSHLWGGHELGHHRR